MKQSILSFGLSEESLRKEIEEKDEQLMAYSHHCRTLEESSSKLQSALKHKERSSIENRVRLADQMILLARKERSEVRKKLSAMQFEVGYTITTPTVSDELGESWVWGQKYKDAVHQNRMYRQYMKSDRRPRESPLSSASTTSSIAAAIRREDMILKEKLEDLEREKTVLLKEVRRITDEDRSRFSTIELLVDRYVMMSLLGRGGFSEVWKAYDIKRCMYVAIKFHQVAPDWSEDRKRNYIRHSKRECEVHMTLDHPKVIQLYDVEILDDNTFVSIMEFSEGCDLDTYIKRHGFLREVEAKTILLQLIQGLRYLAEREERIIHYDLKPANILFSSLIFNCWDIKITDFGLCKIMTKDNIAVGKSVQTTHLSMNDDTEIELTSQGTGTYWYLPPECFQTPMSLSVQRVHGGMMSEKQSKVREPARISAKVDVWALGVVFYQMLFGRRPFGDGLTQKQIWNNNVMGKIREIGMTTKPGKTDADKGEGISYVVFPTKPAVSVEAKEFIKSCLEVKTTERPDIFQLAKHPYVINQLQAWESIGTENVTKIKRSPMTSKDETSSKPSENHKNPKKENSSSHDSKLAVSDSAMPNAKHSSVENDKVEESISHTELTQKLSAQGAKVDFSQAQAAIPFKKKMKRIDPTHRKDLSNNVEKIEVESKSPEPNITFDEYEQLLKSL